MSNFNWEKFGDDIKKTVQDAVDSNDFGELNRTISKTVNEAMGTISDGIKTAGQSLGISNSYQERTKKMMERYQHVNKPAVREKDRLSIRNSAYFSNLTAAKAGGIVMTVLGTVFSSIFFAMFLITLILGVVIPGAATLPVTPAWLLILFGILWLGIGAIGLSGIRKLGRIRRFNNYVNAIGQRGYIEFQKLAQSIGKSTRYLIKDTRAMIRDGWFKQGHIDGGETSLMVTDAVYYDYQKLTLQLQDKKAKEEAEAMRRDTSGLEPDIQEIVKAGEEYVDKIRNSNVKTTCPEIAGKISRIEELLARIFTRVREEPETATDTRRLMDYYLPTTVKLIDAYLDLDAQPVQGANIKKSKKEIESTLDTLNIAFEKMLDSMFQSTAIDVSADISVLNTLLAQEGLTRGSFEKTGKKPEGGE